MKKSRLTFWISLILAATLCGGSGVAEETPFGTSQVPSALVTANTKQVYRFHFSGLQGSDAVRLAEQLWPVISKLPPENPLYRTFLDAKDREGFSDDYRSLRNIFLEVGVDTIYFFADEFWIESKSLPGAVVIPGDAALRDRLQQRLAAAGHDYWATSLAQFQPSPQASGWLVYRVGAAANGQPAPAKRKLVEHALLESCPIQPAAAHLDSLPALHIALNEATPFTVVNLERNKLDAVLTQILTALVPASARTAELSKDVAATTVTASAYPITHVRQVAHLTSVAEATALAQAVQQQINGAVQNVVDLDEEIGPLLGLFAQSMVIVSTQGSDVHMVLKPPALFDVDMAHRKALESQDLDWTALPPPTGYHWEVVGSVGVAGRSDVFARVRAVRVRGTAEAIASEDATPQLARFQIPLADSGLILFRNLKGQLKVDLVPQSANPVAYPALDLLDDRGRLAAVLRLDLGPGDPRFDLARTRAVLAKRIADRKTTEQTTKKKADEVENAHQRAMLDNSALASPEKFEEWQSKLRDAHRAHGMEVNANQVLQDLDDQARNSQRQFPSATLVKDDSALVGGQKLWGIDREKFPFAGQWLFDYGVLTLYQDSSGAVAGVFASKVFYYTGKYEIDGTKPTTGSAMLIGRAKGTKLQFTMFDFRGHERTGTLVLDVDGTGGKWTLNATDTEPPAQATNDVARGSKQSPKKQSAKKSNANAPPISPLGLAVPPRKAAKGAETARSGSLSRIEVAAPDPLWTQEVPTAAFAGYWVHSSDKRMNILFKSQPSGLLEGAQGNIPSTTGNLRGAAAGRLLIILENVDVGIVSPSVRAAVLAADGQLLKFLTARDQASNSGLVGPNSTPLELTRDSSE